MTLRETAIGNRVFQVEFAQPGAFIDALRPGSSLWGDAPGDWMFRGHADAEWKLLASAYRARSWAKFLRDPFDPAAATELERIHQEAAILLAFFKTSDMSGQPIPGDYVAVGGQLAMRRLDSIGWPDAKIVPLMALAQHYGVPTRLLDWTRKALIAAYFAAEGPREVPTSASHLAVWAINGRFLQCCLTHVNNSRCRLVQAPRADNPNMFAQGGIFTHYFDAPDKLEPLDALVDGVMSGRLERWTQSPYWDAFAPEKHTCLMRKLVLPRSEAKSLMRLLHLEDISGVTVFPGQEAVAKVLEERIWCGASNDDPFDIMTAHLPRS